MLREQVALDYSFKILSILNVKTGPILASDLAHELDGSNSYIAKILSKMTNVGLLESSVDGYNLANKVVDLTLFDVLIMCKQDGTGIAADCNNILLELSKQVPLSQLVK